MALGLLTAIVRGMRRKRSSTLNILTAKKGPRDFYKGKGCKPTGFHTRKGGYVLMKEKLPNYIVPDLTGFKLKPYVAYNVHKNGASEVQKQPEEGENSEEAKRDVIS